MFGKLMKYELRYLIRIFAPMWAAVLALCVITRLTLKPDIDGMMVVQGSDAVLPVLLMFLTIFGIMTMMIVAAVALVQRFYKGMYGDEGYLMFTLPVTTGSLINSKALAAMLMMLGTELLTVLGILVLTSYPEIWNQLASNDVAAMFKAVLEMNGLTGVEVALYAFWVTVASIILTAAEVYMVYLAISLGQLWKKHPIAGAIVAYYALKIAISAVEAAIGFNTDFVMVQNIMYEGDYMKILLYSAIRGLILIGISFFGTKLILDKKLNIA